MTARNATADLHQHPDGACLFYEPGQLAIRDEDDSISTVGIGPEGLRALAYRLMALAELIDDPGSE